jgi:hypothetical protein
VPCTLCGDERCDCISSVLDAIHQPDPPEPEKALSARLRPPPAPVPSARPGSAPAPAPAPAPWTPMPPAPGGSWGSWDNPTPWAALPWRGGAFGLRNGWRQHDLLAAEHTVTLVPAGASLERLLFLVGLLLGFLPAFVGAAVGGAIDRKQGRDRLRALLTTPPPVVLGQAGTRVIAREQLEDVRVRAARHSGSATLQLRGGERLRLHWARQPEVPALLRGAFGSSVSVGPYPLWWQALRVAGYALAALFLAVVLVLSALALAGDGTRAPSTTAPTGPQADLVEQRAHAACQEADAAFTAPPERLAVALSNAADAMYGAAELDGRYLPAAQSLLWFRDHTVNGTISVSEAEAAPHVDTLDQACAAHLANDEEPSPTF